MTSDTMKVDWAQPIEVYSDREWHPARIIRHDTGETRYPYCLSYGRYDAQWHDENGKSCCSGDYARNKPAAAVAPEHAPKPPQKPATGPNGVLTGVERLERLEAFVRRLAEGFVSIGDVTRNGITAKDAQDQARALVAEAAPPINPDLIEAREICAEVAEGMGDDILALEYRRGDLDEQFEVRAAIAGIKAGRELGK